ncbi:MAG: glycosyltransferase family 2 protein [Chitinophagia bacterium]|jgi:glycosyltransferase involved in cell wall biosynthesis
MFISGFTIIRNALLNDYPVLESIKSILPLVDEMIVLVGDSQDETENLIRSIGSDKIQIHHSIWDMNLRSGGRVLAVETDKAKALINPLADWAFYIQADEVIHEKYHAAILQGCKEHLDNPKVEGLLFHYLHFYGTYDYIGDSRKWYHKEVRIIRNTPSIQAYKDAQGFRRGTEKIHVKPIEAFVYHYGWVKSPEQMMQKQKNVSPYWLGDADMQKILMNPDKWNFEEFDSLEKFTDKHPAVMLDRIQRKNWQVELDISQKKFSFKNRVLYYFEKLTGIRPFDFKNYRIV